MQVVFVFTSIGEQKTSGFHLEFRNPKPIGLQGDWVKGFNFQDIWVKFFTESISIFLVNLIWTCLL